MPFLDVLIIKGLLHKFYLTFTWGITLEEAVRISETDNTIDIDIAVLEDLIKTNPIKSLSGMNSGTIPVTEVDEEHFDDEVAKLVAHDLLKQLGK